MGGFKKGELITVSKPYAYVLNNNLRGIRCDHCLKKLDGSKHCGQCSFVFYCNRNCQVKAWNTHKTECKLLKKASFKPDAQMRLIALVIFKYKKYGPDEPFEEIFGRKVTFGTLMSHAEDIKKDFKFNKTTEAMMVSVRKFIGDENMPIFDDYIEIYGKVAVNSFQIVENITDLGSGLYLGASVFDHSCKPNASVASEGVDLLVRTNQYIQKRDISKVFISYVEELNTTKSRQDHLMSNYYFLCQCTYCTSPERDELMTRTGGRGCNQMASETMEGIMKLVSLAENLKKVKETSSHVYEDCMENLGNIVEFKSLPDTHISKVKATKLLFDFHMKKGESSEALVYGTELFDSHVG